MASLVLSPRANWLGGFPSPPYRQHDLMILLAGLALIYANTHGLAWRFGSNYYKTGIGCASTEECSYFCMGICLPDLDQGGPLRSGRGIRPRRLGRMHAEHTFPVLHAL